MAEKIKGESPAPAEPAAKAETGAVAPAPAAAAQAPPAATEGAAKGFISVDDIWMGIGIAVVAILVYYLFLAPKKKEDAAAAKDEAPAGTPAQGAAAQPGVSNVTGTAPSPLAPAQIGMQFDVAVAQARMVAKQSHGVMKTMLNGALDYVAHNKNMVVHKAVTTGTPVAQLIWQYLPTSNPAGSGSGFAGRYGIETAFGKN